MGATGHKKRFQIALEDLVPAFVVAGFLAWLNSIPQDVGSGIFIICYGWPFLYSRNTSIEADVDGTEFLVHYALYNLGVAVLVVAALVLLTKVLRKRWS